MFENIRAYYAVLGKEVTRTEELYFIGVSLFAFLIVSAIFGSYGIRDGIVVSCVEIILAECAGAALIMINHPPSKVLSGARP